MVTVRDVAKSAGVSIATVSRVTSGKDGVALDTKEKVLAAAAQLRYAPNPAAASLSRNRSKRPRNTSVSLTT